MSDTHLMNFDDYLRAFDYDERKDMKIGRDALLAAHKAGEVQVIDIRFPEEYAAWHVGFATNIPLNELPDRLDELDADKTIVTLCPHYDRSSIARLFLTMAGFEAKYCPDGLLGLADRLRGDQARDHMSSAASE